MFNEDERRRAFGQLQAAQVDTRLSIGVKKLLMMVEMARQDVDKVEKFVWAVQDECLRSASIPGALAPKN